MAESTIPASIAETHPTPSTSTGWRVAGAFGIGHVVVMLTAFALEGIASVEHGTSEADVVRAYAGVSVGRVELASYVEAMSFLLLLGAVVTLVRMMRRSDIARTAGQGALALVTAYVASTFAVGFPPLTAAVYAAHHGAPAATVATVNDVRNYGFLLQVALSGALALVLGVAAIADGAMRRWLGWGGVTVGVLVILSTPFAHNAMSLLWLVWWVGVSVLCLKRSAKTRTSATL